MLLGSTYSLFVTSDVDENLNVYQTGILDVTYTLDEDNIILTDTIPYTISASKNLYPYRITVTNVGTVAYKFNLILTDTTATDVIDYHYIMTSVGTLEPKRLSACNNNIIKSDIIIPAGEQAIIDVRVWISDDVNNSEIGKSFYGKLSINGLAIYNDNDDIDNSILEDVIPNAPVLDNGLIPVYFDEIEEVWKKASPKNLNGIWYNYDEKRWANAILVTDDSREIYKNSPVHTVITESDILGFFVWIPRFKYRVWNISRQSGVESTYAYPAYTKGIDIKWERSGKSTGNVKCIYDTSISASTSTLSDICTYKEKETITPTSSNLEYTDAWYTHPAFKFDNIEKNGFWIGKFEMTGSTTNPTVLPNVTSLRSKILSVLFTTARIIQNYGLSSSVNAHVLTNLEWGAAAYLTQSIYGLCDGTTCRDVYANNSSGFFTGRSAGVLAKSATASTNGTYDYKGYTVSNSALARDESKVASTTGNVTGVYDLSGGGYEMVMGNMVNSSGVFNADSAGTNWDGSTTLDSKYYNSYSYGTVYYNQANYNRARLGDATAEVTSRVGDSYNAWQPGAGINGSFSGFPSHGSSSSIWYWFIRGGFVGKTYDGIFYFNKMKGGSDSNGSVRVSIS